MLNEFRAFILADSAVTNLIGTRLYPVSLPQAPTFPAATYTVVSAARNPTMLHNDNLPQRRIQIDVWSRSAAQAVEVGEAIRQVFHYYQPTNMGESPGVFVSGVFLDLERSDYEPDTKLYRWSADYLVHYAEN